jgi:sigma-B regulation protein RsbU (phosphoserine phosphatase)
MFDVFRIDENTTGFYLTDAVGHGMAASLLTMFIKRSIVSKEVKGDNYVVLSPSEAMTILNDALTEQKLPNCQFVTACYGLIHHPSHTLQYARGGHPYPVLLTANGAITELKVPGGLLGVFKETEFPTFETSLNPGDKLWFYSDGLDTAFDSSAGYDSETPLVEQAFGPLARLPIDDAVRQLESRLEAAADTRGIRDDVTVVGLEVLR